MLVILQNSDFEEPGYFTEWASQRGIAFHVVKVFEGEALPSKAEKIMVLGAPNSVTEISQTPWMQSEANYLAEAIRAGTPIFGVCFGAQLLAHLLGGDVMPGPHAEIGWHSVEMEGKKFPLFLWHKEIFTLPPGATALGKSAGCALQGFRKNNVTAWGGHPEITSALVGAFVDRCWSDAWWEDESRLGIANFVQKPKEMFAKTDEMLKESRRAIESILKNWYSQR